MIDDVVDEVDVIALPADERIVAAAAIEGVVAVIAGDLVRQIVAGGGDIGGAGDRQVLDLHIRHAEKGEADILQQHRIDALAEVLGYNIVRRIDDVSIVTIAAL